MDKIMKRFAAGMFIVMILMIIYGWAVVTGLTV